jgi:hypothetical protein
LATGFLLTWAPPRVPVDLYAPGMARTMTAAALAESTGLCVCSYREPVPIAARNEVWLPQGPAHAVSQGPQRQEALPARWDTTARGAGSAGISSRLWVSGLAQEPSLRTR